MRTFSTRTILSCSQKSAAFTIVEVLTMVSVIIGLSSLMLPVLARARESARTAMCGTNLRQMSQALKMYTTDHAGMIFPMQKVIPGEGTQWWFGFEALGGPTTEGDRILDRTRGHLWPYYQVTDSIEVCPSFKVNSTNYKPKFTTHWTTYGLPLDLMSPGSPTSVKRISSPSQTLAFADAAQINAFQAPASPTNPMFEQWYYVNQISESVHYVHNHRASAVMFDGHVEFLTPDTDLNLTFPEAPIGRPPSSVILSAP